MGPLHAEADDAELSEINVTPFIDVMLVLLIIFMVAAPLATVDVPVDLPGSTAKPQPKPEAPLYVSLTADGGVRVGDVAAGLDAIGAALDAASKGDRETRIYLRADRSVDYGRLMTAMDALRDAGYLKVALVALEDAR